MYRRDRLYNGVMSTKYALNIVGFPLHSYLKVE